MYNFKKTIIVSTSIFCSWALFEIIIHQHYKKKIKEQIYNFINDLNNNKYKIHNCKSFTIINTEINKIKNNERNHVVMSLKRTFINRSSSNLESLIKQLEDYRVNINNTFYDINKILYIDKMLWYPYIFRLFFTFLNNCNIIHWKLKYSFDSYEFKKHYIYRIRPKDKNYKKTIVIFIGFGGILQPFYNIIDILISNNYQIIIPIYGPSQANLSYRLDCHEIEFHIDLYEFLNSINIKETEILCWSLGGILYKGFENLILNLKKYNKRNIIEIKKVFLFEPLIGIRGCMDTYFSRLRNYDDTLDIFNSVTQKKYFGYNRIFSYFIHTIIGYSTSNSFGCFNNVEIKEKPLINYPRYLFISTDDIVINYNLDRDLIDNNFDLNKIYHRPGYHGGWLNSSKLEPIFNSLIK